MVDPDSWSWRKSSYSNAGDNCVEVAALAGGGKAVRDSKRPTEGALLITWPAAHSWLTDVKTGRYDLPG